MTILLGRFKFLCFSRGNKRKHWQRALTVGGSIIVRLVCSLKRPKKKICGYLCGVNQVFPHLLSIWRPGASPIKILQRCTLILPLTVNVLRHGLWYSCQESDQIRLNFRHVGKLLKVLLALWMSTLATRSPTIVNSRVRIQLKAKQSVCSKSRQNDPLYLIRPHKWPFDFVRVLARKYFGGPN